MSAWALLTPQASVAAAPPLADKSGYHLFHPTPPARLREMSTDRPDQTESPYTVDAGHFQWEMDLVNYTHNHDASDGGDTRTDGLAIGPLNLKAGLFNNVDLQLMLAPYNHVRTEDRGAGIIRRQSGFGDVTVRLKRNFWGNDGGRTAFAMMPYVKLPTSPDNLGNQAIEGGVILPLAVELPGGWGMGAMTEFDWQRNDGHNSYQASFVNTITFSHDIAGQLGGYMEFYSAVSTERGSHWVGMVDFGLTYGLTENLQLDAGINIGVTPAADDLNPFIGLAVRF